MSDSLFYFVVKGHTVFSSWQMGIYATSANPSIINAKNTWQGWTNAFFTAGTLHAFGYHKYMNASAGEDAFLTYTVDQATDRKTLVDSALFPGVGNSANTSMPHYIAPYFLMRPQITRPHQLARMYLPPITTQAVQGGALLPLAQQEISDFLHDAFAIFTSQDLHAVVRNRGDHSHARATTYGVSSSFAAVLSRSNPAAPAYLGGAL